MKTKWMSVMGVLVLLGCGTLNVWAKEKNSWPEKMKKLQTTLQAVLADVSSDERFYDPKNFKRIEKNVLEFSKLAHEISRDTPISLDGDPIVGMIAGEFSREAKNVAQTLKWGQRPYARNVLRSMTQYCIACHTKNPNGPQFAGLSQAPTFLKEGSLDRANYLTAVREFDQAYSGYLQIIESEKSAPATSLNWEKAVRMSLAISVRVKNDPDLSLKVVAAVSGTKNAPLFIKEQASAWRIALEKWKKEKPVAKNEEALFNESLRLVQEAKDLQKYPVDRSADVLFLRASAIIHDQLALAPNGKRAAEAMYLAGTIYDVLGSAEIWDMSSLFYLGCIAKVPHTAMSRNCYRQYEEKIYFSYSGSSGTHLPPEVKKQLNELDLLSIPQDQKPKVERSVN